MIRSCSAALLTIVLSLLPAHAGQTPSATQPGTSGWLATKAFEGDVLRAGPVVPPELMAAPVAGEPEYSLVKVRMPVEEAVLQDLRGAGLELLDYLPVATFVVRGPAGAAAAARSLPSVLWTGAFHPFYKIDPAIGRRTFGDGRDAGYRYLNVEVWPGESMDAAARKLAAAGAQVIQVWDDLWVRRVRCRVLPGLVASLAHVREVKFLEEVGEIVLRNDATTWVCQSNQSLLRSIWDAGIQGENQIAGHIDGRIDRNHCDFLDPIDNTPGPAHRKLVAYRSGSGFGSDSHGTHTGGTVAGDQSVVNPGVFTQNGNAWLARISHSNLDDITGSGTQTSNLAQYLTSAHGDGARAHTNSWGDDGTTAYTTWCVDIDTFSRQFEDSLVVFAETNQGGQVRTPENAKNCLAVGLTDPPPNQHRKPWGGSAPTSDGRRKPEIFAPGSNTFSSDNNTSCSFVGFGGTSMASPAVTGNALLARQYYEEGWYPTGAMVPADGFTPTAALMKATLMNATVDMTAISGYPTNGEGWGRLLLEDALYFDGDARELQVHDVRNASGLSTGGVTDRTVAVASAGERFRVTLVFTDQPASLLASSAPINDLDLEVVSPTGITYLGNVFDTAAGQSIPGGSPDDLNNVENVLLAVPEVGDYTVRVHGTNVPQGPQGYALVITGDLGGGGTAPTAEFSGTPTTGPAPLSVAFTDLSTGVPTSWSWAFGDGGTSTLQNPTHVYGTPGTFTVTLTATNAFGSDVETKQGYIVATGSTIVAEEILTGAGPGPANAAVVKSWDHAAPPAVVASWTAYAAPGFGVNVAAGELLAGAPAEVLSGPGPGTSFGPQVRGFAATGTPIAKINFFAYGTLKYGVHVAAGDVDGDGDAEILTAPGPGSVFGPHVRGWDYGGSITPIGKISFYAYGTLRWGARIAAGDTDDDGFAEILTGAGSGDVFGPHVKVFNYDGGAGGCTASFFAFPTGKYGAAVAAGDTDADGAAEVLATHGPDPLSNAEARGFSVAPSCGVSFTWSILPFPSMYGAEPAAGDLDADGQAEVLVAPGGGAPNPSNVAGYEIAGAGGSPIPGLSFPAYPGQTYGTKVAVGDLGTP